MAKPGYIMKAPKDLCFYTISGLPAGFETTTKGSPWFRDGVHFATSSACKSRKSKETVEVWGAQAETFVRQCNGALVCDAPDCERSVSKRFLSSKQESDRHCPVHGTELVSVNCCAKWKFYHEIDGPNGQNLHREGLLTFVGHSPKCKPFSMSHLKPNSKDFIARVVSTDPNVTYRKLVGGKYAGCNDASRRLVKEDPAFANEDLVAKHIKRCRLAIGNRKKETGIIQMILNAIERLHGEYVVSGISLARGPTPCVICADDRQLYFLCSSKHFLVQVADNTYGEISGSWDDWDQHGLCVEKMMTLCLFRIYGVAKTANAFAFYLHHLRRECNLRGFTLEWGVSTIAQGVDFHHGQALGFLRHFIEVYGIEEGPKKYLEILTGDLPDISICALLLFA